MRLIITKVAVISVLAFLIAGFAITGYAQTIMSSGNGSSVFQVLNKPKATLRSVSLLDPDRFTMKNQYLMNFSSVGGSGSLMGMYINTMEYHFNCPVVMRLKVAYQSKTGNMFGNKDAFTGNPNYQDGRLFIPSFDVVYTPWKNTSISFHFRDHSSGNPNYGYGGYDRFGRYSRYGSYGFSPFSRY